LRDETITSIYKDLSFNNIFRLKQKKKRRPNPKKHRNFDCRVSEFERYCVSVTCPTDTGRLSATMLGFDQENEQEKRNVKITICEKKKKDEQARNNKEIF
jgi:hypothetical protein